MILQMLADAIHLPTQNATPAKLSMYRLFLSLTLSPKQRFEQANILSESLFKIAIAGMIHTFKRYDA